MRLAVVRPIPPLARTLSKQQISHDLRGSGGVRAFAESVERYDAAPAAVGTIAAAMMIRHGDLVVWENPRYVVTAYDQGVIDAWVRLQVTRGRRFRLFSASELLFSRNPQQPALADAPQT